MPKPRQMRTDTELRSAAHHVQYEVAMLIFSAEHVGGCHSSPMSTPEGNEKNMALESFLLHFRNLRAFLCPSLQTLSDDDIIASDYFGESVARDIGDPGTLAVDKARLDKMLAHLSYSRPVYIDAGDHGWNVAQVAALILTAMAEFLKQLEGTKYASFFADLTAWKDRADLAIRNATQPTEPATSTYVPPKPPPFR